MRSFIRTQASSSSSCSEWTQEDVVKGIISKATFDFLSAQEEASLPIVLASTLCFCSSTPSRNRTIRTKLAPFTWCCKGTQWMRKRTRWRQNIITGSGIKNRSASPLRTLQGTHYSSLLQTFLTLAFLPRFRRRIRISLTVSLRRGSSVITFAHCNENFQLRGAAKFVKCA